VSTAVAALTPLADERVAVVLQETPFYAEAGGQVGDRGVIEGPSFRITVEDTQRRGAHTIHIGCLEGALDAQPAGAGVTARVDHDARAATQRNHTATHLLHAALRRHLGTHVEQRGSLVAPDRLRFDFTHFSPVTREELRRVQQEVNHGVVANVVVEASTCTLEEAKARGAMALFGEKYGDEVRMISIGEVSRELCGGTHVARTGDIGTFRIVSEGSVAAGIRRIEAVSGPGALALWDELEDLLGECAETLKTSPGSLPRRIAGLQTELRTLRQKKASVGAAELRRGTEAVGPLTGDWRVLAVDGIEELRRLWDRLRDGLKGTILVLFGTGEGRSNLLVCLSPDLRGRKGLHCGNLARAAGKAMGAGGGGRPDMGQAGGKSPEKVDEALAALLVELNAQV
jgi:alanyl-tRNA synthetase